jgi:hypothetical protein
MPFDNKKPSLLKSLITGFMIGLIFASFSTSWKYFSLCVALGVCVGFFSWLISTVQEHLQSNVEACS